MQGIWETASQGGSISFSKVRCMDVKVVSCCGFCAIDSRSHFGNVQIDFQDSLFAPDLLDQDGEVRLDAFSQPGPGTPGEAVLGSLLADGTAATDRTAVE